jgi:hypothetical protein
VQLKVRYDRSEELGYLGSFDRISQASNLVFPELDGQSNPPNFSSVSSRMQRQTQIRRVLIPAT